MKKIAFLQTGGTIAMHFNGEFAELDPEKWSSLLFNEIPELSDIADIVVENVFFEDSSDIHHEHWTELSEKITSIYNQYDGFVILHGTDTMAYTASALSFKLRNLQKPVIFTGSQVPLSNIRSDARRNLINSIELATRPLCEVAICFNDHLYRGNRSSKMSIGDFDAFTSPNYPPLAEIGIDIEMKVDSKKPSGSFYYDPGFDNSIHLIKIYPGLQIDMLDCIDLSFTKAVIIEAFGSGNFPIKGSYNLLRFIEKCRNQNCEVIITSQAAYDSVNLGLYPSGQAADHLGALSAGPMTIEATLTKIMHLLSKNSSDQEFKNQFTTDICGELTG